MKSILMSLVLLITFSPMAQAGLMDHIASIKAEDFDYGVLGGGALNQVDNSSSIESVNLINRTTVENKPGFHIGGRVRYNFTETIKIGLDLSYTRYRTQLKETVVSGFTTENERNITLDYINIKPHVTFLTNFGISLTAGFGLGLNANSEVEHISNSLGLKTTTNVNLADEQGRTSIFGSIGYEWELMGHTLIPEVGYEFAVTDAFGTADVTANRLSQSVDAKAALLNTRINSLYFQLVFLL